MKANNRESIFDKSFCISLVAFTITLAILVNYVIEISKSISGSMSPAIETGDIVIYNRLAYKFGKVNRGDSISFKHNDDVYGKRVVAVSGDTIAFHNGYVYVNDEKLDESEYIGEDIETNCTKAFEVPEGYVFVLGDNREDSNDSRFWDEPYVAEEDIIGRQLVNISAIFEFTKKTEEKDIVATDKTGKIKKDFDSTKEFSDIYNKLTIGEKGYFYTAIYENASYMINNVTIEEIYTGADAESIIKQYYETSDNALGGYQDAPDGYSWHVARYSLGNEPDKSYANIRVESTDGNRLRYEGETCTTRTYDMINNWKNKTDLYCYYAVPDGCTEYVLEVGDRKRTMEEGAYQTAFYRISNF